MLYPFIAIEGNIGAGKTSLTKLLASEKSCKLILEQFEDNSFLPKFYNNPEKYSFPLELSFLAERYQQLKSETSQNTLFEQQIFSDYFIYKCLIFAQANLAQDEFKLYQEFFNIVISNIRIPDLLVYLYVDIDVLLANIKKRGREYELNIKADYLINIQKGYINFFEQFSKIEKTRVLLLDVSNLDFVSNESDLKKIESSIYKDYSFGLHRELLL
jgi:deoxyadenosine/deoxycytidine kinase